MSNLWIDDDVIDRMCQGVTQKTAKVRALKAMGLTVAEAPNGRPLVLHSNVALVFGGMPQALQAVQTEARTAPVPNRAAFKLLYGRKAA